MTSGFSYDEFDKFDDTDVYFPTENRAPGGFMFDGDEPEEGEEPIYYGGAMTFHDADVIFEQLMHARLIDVRGRPQRDDGDKYQDENGVCLLGQGKKYGSSFYSGDDVDAYFIDAEVWTKAELNRFGMSAAFMKARLVDDDDVLALIGGDNWAVWISQGAKDAEIHPEIARRVLDALGQGMILWSKEVPEPRRPESRYYDVMSLMKEIAGSQASPVIHVQFHDFPHISEVLEERQGSEYLRELFDRNQFLSGFVSVSWENSGRQSRLTFDALIEDHFGADNPRWLNVYLEDPRPSRFIADDGWVVRVVAEDDEYSALDLAAAAIQSKVGGKIYDPEPEF